MHTLRILLALGPFVGSLLRDQRRWLWWGAPLTRTPAFHARRASALIAKIAELGPTFVKLAQVFAARADLIPEPYLSALGTLTDQVPPVSWEAIDAELRAAYHEAPDTVFERIDRTPIAAASLGQVHRAQWRGRDVAVKVLRPGVEHTVARDLTSARAITAWAARRWPVPHVLGFQSLVEEFAARIGEEMDFRLEGEYATEVRANFRGNPRVVIPEIMHEMTRQRVIVLEFIVGQRVDRLQGRVDAGRLAGLVMEVYVQMMLVDGLFHADPHAGNLLFTTDGRLVLLDFGMMVRVPTATRLALIRTVFASIRRDARGVSDGFTALGLVVPGADPAEILRLAEVLVELSVTRTTTQQRLETMLADTVMASLYDFPVILPRDLVYFARTAALIEGIGTRYDPYFNAIQVGTPLVMRMRSRILRSLGEEAKPSIEEYAAIAGFAVGRAWRAVREVVRPLLDRARVPVVLIAAALRLALHSALPLALPGNTAMAQSAPAAAAAAVARATSPVPAATAIVRVAVSDSLAQRVADAVREEGLVGATFALVVGDTVSLGAAGTRDVRTGAPMRVEHRVQLGSVAKTILALGVLRLVTEGRLALDAPLTRYLPGLPIDNPFESTSPILVRHLLDHTAGLDDVRLWQVFTLRGDPDAPLAEGLVRAGNRLRVRHRPGERFSYSNTGFLVLGMLVESVSGTRYETYLESALLAPLQMHRSTSHFVSQTGGEADTSVAMGHFDIVTTSAAMAIPVRPASQFTTTAEDMARLARFMMSDGVVNGVVVVDSTLLRAMAAPTGTEAARAGLAAGYALGLSRRDRHGVIGGCHFGNNGTFRAALCVYPEAQRAFFVAFNTDPEQANFDRVDALLTRALDLPLRVKTPVAAPTIDVSRWEGRYLVRPVRFAQFAYLDELTGVTQVTWNRDTLRFAPLQGTARALVPVGGARFRADGRSEASHVLASTTEGKPFISDGQRTWERVSFGYLLTLWTSAALGVLGLLHLLVVGTTRTLRARARGDWRAEPMAWPTLALALLALSPLLYLSQGFLAIGDLTIANGTIAALTLLLPLALIGAIIIRVRAGTRTVGARLDLLSMLMAAQWLGLLAYWGLVPLTLWR